MTDFIARERLAEDIAAIGVRHGDTVMVHAAISRIGRMIEGPDTLIAALADVLGTEGTLVGYADWNTDYEELADAEGRVPAEWRAGILPFDPASARAIRHNGSFPEFLRGWPGTIRSANPGAGVVARGARAAWLTADHAIDYGYGPASPFAKLVEAEAKVLMLGAPRDTLTLLHHAEHLADIPRKRIRRLEVPFVTPAGTEWRMTEEYDTADPVHIELADDYFGTIVDDFVAAGGGREGLIGKAPSLLLEAAPLVAFAVQWIERQDLA